MKHISKRILLAGTITVVPVFLIISGATANALELPFLNFERFINKQELTLEEQGLNEYVDPTQFPKYYQNYNEIYFHEDGVTPEEFQELNDLLKLDQVSGEKPKAQFKVSDEETLTVEITDDLHGLREKFNQKKSERNQQKALTESISFESTLITSVSFNSDPTDEKVAQMNYYRGKDESLETLKKTHQEIKEALQAEDYSKYLDEITKYQLGVQDTVEGVKQEGEVPQESRVKANDKVEKLKKSLKEQEKELDQKITEREQRILTGKPEWQQKKSAKSDIIERVGSKVTYAHSTPNKPIMDILYPSKEEIDALNSEIIAERQMIEEYDLDRTWRQEAAKQKFLSHFLPQEAYAGYLNNFIASMRIYNRTNYNLSFDVWASAGKFVLYGNSGTGDQKFYMNDDTGQIIVRGKCVEVNNSNYSNGGEVVWRNCDSGKGNQKFIAYPDGSIRPLHNQSYCLDASSGVTSLSLIHLWECYDGERQQFQIGEDDFEKFNYYIRLHAASRESLELNSAYYEDSSMGLNFGHALVSTPKYEKSNEKWHPTNSFSIWNNGNRDHDESNGISYGEQRTNNIKTDWNIHVDGGGGSNHDRDWMHGTKHLADFGGEFYGYRRTTSQITKQRFEELKFMRGFEEIEGGKYKNSGYNVCLSNCSSYAVNLYNEYNKSSDTEYYPWNNPWYWPCSTPVAIYDKL